MRSHLVLFVIIGIIMSVGFGTWQDFEEATPSDGRILPSAVPRSPSISGTFQIGASPLPTSSGELLGMPEPPIPDNPPGPEDRAEYMIGTVAVTTIFPESNGALDPSTETWTPTRMDKVFDEIYTGLAWWEAQMPNGRLEFTVYSLDQRTTSYEPITRPSSDQHRWVGEIMNNLGYTSGDYIQDVIDLNNDVRNTYGKDWAFTAFMVDSFNDADGTFDDGVSGYAFGLGGPFMVMTYDNNGWGVNNMDKVMAHETGHMFYATDEYTRPGEWSGYLNILEVDDSGCLMDTADWCLSTGTMGQIGWRDTDGDNIMDPEDTEPNTILDPQPANPTTDNILTFAGTAEEIATPNQNPHYISWLNGHRVNAGNDISINVITLVQYTIDGGVWLPTTPLDGAFDEAIEEFTFTTSMLSDGTHTIETRARNTVGNWETSFSEEIITVDTTPPTTAITVDGTIGTNGWFNNDPIVSLVPSDAVTGIQYTRYKLNGGGWQDYLGPFVVKGDGIFLLEYYAVDNVDLMETSNTVEIKIDATKPSTSESPTGALGINGWYTSNVTIVLTANDLMSGILDTLYSIDGGTYQSYSGPFVVTGDWSHSVSFFSQDFAGNTEDLRSIEVRIDATAPNTENTLDGTMGSNDWYISSVMVELNPLESASGVNVSKYSINGGAWLDYVGPFPLNGDGVHSVEFYSSDYAGNIEATETIQVKIDVELPSTTWTPTGTIGSDGWFTSSVTVDFVASDTISGLGSTFFRMNDGAWQILNGVFVVSGEGHHTIQFYSVDIAGNMEAIKSVQVSIDTEMPNTNEILTGTAGSGGWYTSEVIVDLTDWDGTSGVDETWFRIDGGHWQIYTDSLTFDSDGTFAIEFYSKDKAGNVEGIKTIQVRIDTQAPFSTETVLGTLGSNGWYMSGITFELQAMDETSGVMRIEFCIDGGAWLDYEGVVEIVDDGEYVIALRSMDNAGNVEDSRTIEVRLDLTDPSIDSLAVRNSDEDGRFTLSTAIALWTGSDQTSEIDGYEVKLDNSDYISVSMSTSHNFTGLKDGPHTITVRATDQAGNSHIESIQFTSGGNEPSSSSSLDALFISIIIIVVVSVIAVLMLSWRRRRQDRQQA